MNRASLVYLLIVSIVGLGIFGIIRLGNALPPPQAQPEVSAPLSATNHVGAKNSPSDSIQDAWWTNAKTPLSRLFMQLLVIIAASSIAGRIMTRCGQPAVIGEMIAGILLGSSLFGLLARDAFQFIFASTSLGALQLFSQIGICLFMFSVGMDLDIAHVRSKAQTALVVSHASIVIPFFLGAVLSLWLYTAFANPGASFTAFSLFLGISMSITAFPVLARILQERGLAKTPLGATAITCAAIDDITAWTILALIVAVARATGLAAAGAIFLAVLVFLALMVGVVRPGLPRLLGPAALNRPEPSPEVLAAVVGVVLAAALTTELIGIHALFGAFLAGTIMPRTGNFRQKLSVRVANFSAVLFLPLFFAFTGLRTQIALFHGWQDWLICLGIIVIATLGKLGGGAVSARLTGVSWRESLQLGALMNTRGLMELIALNLGYDLGILSPRIFAMFVVMALATTAMTGPLLTLFRGTVELERV